MFAMQTTAPSAAPEASAATPSTSTFEPVQNAPEQHSGMTLMVEAYALIWILLMGWLVMMWRKQNTLNTRLDDLERALDRAAATKGQK
jgi:CcmD family protein